MVTKLAWMVSEQYGYGRWETFSACLLHCILWAILTAGYQLNDHVNVKTMDARMCVLSNGAKTEMIAPQNDRAMERNVNFLLTATIIMYIYMYIPCTCTCICTCNHMYIIGNPLNRQGWMHIYTCTCMWSIHTLTCTLYIHIHVYTCICSRWQKKRSDPTLLVHVFLSFY